MVNPATLVLADGSILEGESIGAEGEVVGELAFYRGATGFQETLSNPTYRNKIITFTTPHIGNTGANQHDNHTESIEVSGAIVRNLALCASNFRSEETFGEFLRRRNIVAIAEIDTRDLSNRFQESGVVKGCIITGKWSHEELQEKAKKLFKHSFPSSIVKVGA